MKKSFYVLFITLVFLFLAETRIFAGEIDILVDKLIEKGVLTKDEAQEVIPETKKGSRERKNRC